MESNEGPSSGRSSAPQLPPGFRFHPTDEELVVHYLKRKADAAPLPVAIIADVDLYKFDPWELPGKAVFGEQEWYFFSPRDRKYPNGARPNRAANSGYWKATGTDKPVLTAGGREKVGVKKALVFYGGKPPKGIKTNWIMHEYRLLGGNNLTNRNPDFGHNNKKSSRLDDWVLCRIYKKIGNPVRAGEINDDRIGASISSSLSVPMGQQMMNSRVQPNSLNVSMNPSLPFVYGNGETRACLADQYCNETSESIATLLGMQVSQNHPCSSVLGSQERAILLERIGDNGVFGQQPTTNYHAQDQVSGFYFVAE